MTQWLISIAFHITR